MLGTKISTTIDSAITLGSAGYTGPISITSTGAIEPVQRSITALTVPARATHATVTNHGLIVGGYANAHGFHNLYGTPGGDGVRAGSGASIVNDGTILGGGSDGNQYTTFGNGFNGGGIGVDIYGAQARLTNNGVIDGGADAAGGGGIGVSVSAGAVVVNHGTIAGGAVSEEGGTSGVGVSVQDAKLINYGTIEAGYDIARPGATGTDGVILSAGSMVNHGVVIGGVGGAQDRGSYGYRFGTGGVGVTITAGSRLVNDAKIYGGNGNKDAGIGGAGVSAYGPSTIINNGRIVGGRSGAVTQGNVYVYTGVGGDGVDILDGAGLTNHGAITGGAGGAKGSYGGAGVALTYQFPIYNHPAALNNQGVITGGKGGKGAGGAGAGIVVARVGHVSNEGIVEGGLGGAAGYNAYSGTTKVNGGEGGEGLLINGSGDPGTRVSGTNVGVIIGGNGGARGPSGLMGHGGIGLVMSGNVRFTNAGDILGGKGGAAQASYQAGYVSGGGYGAIVSGATLVNTGAIAAGASEAAGSNGSAGIYDFGGDITNRGLITGGISGAGIGTYPLIQSEGNNGGTGLVQNGGTTMNFGTILGGAGGNARSGEFYFGAHGGYGIRVRGANPSPMYQATFLNYGTISGGSGGINTHQTGQEGLGGTGAFVGDYVSFRNAGLIEGGGKNSLGIYVDDQYGSVSNSGTIASGLDGIGLLLVAGSLTNSGKIIGDFAAAYIGTNMALTNSASGLIAGGVYTGTRGAGSGVIVQTSGSLVNAGTIIGGTDEATVDGVIKFQLGGFGVGLAPNASGSNTGIIRGGSAGPEGNNTIGAGGGTGVFMTDYQSGYYGGYYNGSDHTVLSNSGQIIGAAGGTGSEHGGAGGIGVHLTGGTLFNAGTITGGAGGYGKLGNGANGDAVLLGNDSTLVVENGAVFNGLVVAQNTEGNYPDLLQLAGLSSTPLTGIGTQIIGFDDIDFAANASWTLSGDSAGLATNQSIEGFTSSDAIELTDAAAGHGQVSVGNAGVVTISAGGDIYHLDIAGATVGQTNFTFSDYTLRETDISPAPAMMFLRPAEPAPASPSFFNALGLEQFMSAQAFHGSLLSGAETVAWANHTSLTAGSHFGVIQDFSKLPQGDVQTVVTLHA